MSSASPPLRVTGVVLRVAVKLICLCGAGVILGTVGDVLMGTGKTETHKHVYIQHPHWTASLKPKCSPNLKPDNFNRMSTL